jgi:hypothetical protein
MWLLEAAWAVWSAVPFASGMDAHELKTFIGSLDWDQLFGGSYRQKDVYTVPAEPLICSA